MKHKNWDVVVVGARVAGSATAMLLARAGLRVLVLDRMRPGADALSTHALMRAGTLQLQRWGLLDRVVAAGTPPVRRIVFHYGDGETVPVSLKPAAGVDALYAPRRTVLDPILADEAVRSGATVEFGATVTAVLRDGIGRVVGVRVRDADGRQRDERADLVVGADGRASLVADQVGAPTLVAGRGASSIMYGYFADLPSDGYEWFWSPRRAAGIIPTSGGLSCVFVGGAQHDVESLRRRLAPQELFRTLAGESSHGPDLLDRLAAATPVERLRHDTGRPGHLRTPWGPGWALVGDAGYWKDPLSTHGITDALRDAELLARAVIAAHSVGGAGSTAGAAAMAGYQTTRDRLSMQMVDVVERVTAFEWDLTAVRGLLRELASAMSDEVEALSELPSAA
jgi:flavin-dependent dehydrogenase